MSTTVDKLTKGVPTTLDEGTRLSLKRTQLSAERTLMSWIRTAVSTTSRRFTPGKCLDSLANQHDSRLPPAEHSRLAKLRELVGLALRHRVTWQHRRLQLAVGDVQGR